LLIPPWFCSFLPFPGRLVGSISTGKTVFQLAAGYFFLIQAKRQWASAELEDFIPAAVTQAMTVSSNMK